MRRLWVPVSEIIEQGSSLSLGALARRAKQAAGGADKELKPGGKPLTGGVPLALPGAGKKEPRRQKQKGGRKKFVGKPKTVEIAPAREVLPAPKKASGQKAQPVVGNRWDALPGDEPTLAEITRPDLPSGPDRHQAFHDAYHDKNAHSDSISHLPGSSNAVFHGVMKSGHRYWAKPLAGALAQVPDGEVADPNLFEASEWARRHNAVYDIASAMGAHHMMSPGLHIAKDGESHVKMHGHEQMGPDVAYPEENISEKRKLLHARTHAGADAHVTEHVPGADTAWNKYDNEGEESLGAVDYQHRLHGLVLHFLSGNADGHGNNVLINHNTGHPILIDQDNVGESKLGKINEYKGNGLIRSVFSKGSLLDIGDKSPEDERGRPIPTGVNFPPRMSSVLEMLAAGKHPEGKPPLNLSDQDAAGIKKRAQSLLDNGLEGAINRHGNVRG